MSTIAAAARLGRFWRQRVLRRNEGCAADGREGGTDQAGSIKTATTIDTLKDALSEEGGYNFFIILV